MKSETQNRISPEHFLRFCYLKFDDIEKNKICKTIPVGEDEYRYTCIGADTFPTPLAPMT